jgi:hypothetical protein
MKKVLYLFDPDEYLPRQTATETEFTEHFKEILPDLYHAYEYAFDRMCEKRSKRKVTEMTARWPSDNVNGFLYDWLVNNPGTSSLIRRKTNTFYLETGEYRLTFKKVDQYYRPSYNTNEHNMMLQRNLTASEEDLRSVIFVGYRVDPSWSVLEGVYAISRNGNDINWIIDLAKFASGAGTGETLEPIILNPADMDIVPEPELKLKIKDKRKDNKVG